MAIPVAFSIFGSPDKGVAAQSEAEKSAVCRKDLQCWGTKGIIGAGLYCKDAIERLAAHSVKWKDGTFDTKFSRFAWLDKDKGVVSFYGDKAEFQNGFGAFTSMTYRCDFNQDTHEVLNTEASEGRLPPYIRSPSRP